ncbi:MAG: hypothetical protein K8T25_18235 [Planctomycetia bacterium]|nr:hypothetical protein [Planctomycetia bacterium]
MREVGPEVFYLPDEQGKLHPVPGWTLEDFRRLIAQQPGRERPPQYSLHRLVARGTVVGDHARLKVEINVKLYGQRPGDWVRVPLQMAGAVMEEPPQFSGQGGVFLEYQEAGDGYVAWLRATGEEARQLTLSMLLPLKSIGGGQQLSWNVPRVAPSQLMLLVPLPKVDAEVSEGCTLLPPTPQGAGNELTVLGLAGEFQLTWRAPDQQVSSREQQLEVAGAHLVRIERGQVRTQAQLTIRSLGSEFDRVRVSLPQGARLVGDGQPNLSVVSIGSSPAASGRPAAPMVEVRLNKKTRGPVDVRLICEQSYDLGSGPKAVELGGFQVEGAVRHWGNIAVQVAGDWRLVWAEATNVRRVDAVPANLPSDDLTAAFEYFGQPYLLSARILPPTTRVSVEPEYVVDVSAEAAAGAARLQLDAKFKYLVNGAKVFSLSVDMGEWELDDAGLGPAGRVDLNHVVAVPGQPLKIPLVAAVKGEFDIWLKAHRKVPNTAGGLTFGLPKPLVDNPGSATVAILPADNVQITPRREAMIGLLPLPVAPPIELPPREQTPLYYRSDQPDVRFVGDFQVHGREVVAGALNRVRISEHTADVRQALDFDIAYEPVDWLSLDVPQELSRAERVRVTVGGEAVTPVEQHEPGVPKLAAGGSDKAAAGGGQPVEGMVRWRLPLRGPRIGRVPVSIRYQVDLERSNATSLQVMLPLIMPADARQRSNQLLLEPAPGVTVEPVEKDWAPDDEQRQAVRDEDGRRYAAKTWTARVGLIIGVLERPTLGAVIIHRGWVQSWYAADGRHDQAAYVVSCRDERFTIALPSGAQAAAAEVWLDGQAQPAKVDSGGQLLLAWPRTETQRHRLLIRYLVPAKGLSWLRPATIPRFPEGTWAQKLYWQLILPPADYLLSAPEKATPEYVWRWQRFQWCRQPLLSSGELADWIGIPEADSVVPTAANQYLLSVSTTGDAYLLSIVPRSALVLLTAGCVLCLGLLWIHVRWMRHPGVVFAAAVTLCGLGLLYPEPAVLLAQVSVFGLVLVLLFGGLRRRYAERRSMPVAAGNTPSGSHRGIAATEFFVQGGPPTSSGSNSPGGAGAAEVGSAGVAPRIVVN